MDRLAELARKLLDGTLDPRDESAWAPLAGRVASELQAEGGADAAARFWRALADRFADELEPRCGPLPRGRLLLEQGRALAGVDLDRAEVCFERALEAEREWALTRGLPPAQIALLAGESTAAVALAILERVRRSALGDRLAQARFWTALFSAPLGGALQGEPVPVQAVRDSLRRRASGRVAGLVASRYEELDRAAVAGLPFATVCCAASIVEALLLDLHLEAGTTRVRERDRSREVGRASLHSLLDEAERGHLIGLELAVASRVVAGFRERLGVGSELELRRPLTPRVARALRGLLDRALLA